VGPDRNPGPFCLPLKPQKNRCYQLNWFHGVIHHKRKFVVITYRPNEKFISWIWRERKLCKGNWKWVITGDRCDGLQYRAQFLNLQALLRNTSGKYFISRFKSLFLFIGIPPLRGCFFQHSINTPHPE